MQFLGAKLVDTANCPLFKFIDLLFEIEVLGYNVGISKA